MKIGSLCEVKWSEMSEAAAWSAYENQPYVHDIREEQARLNAIPIKLRSDGRASERGSADDLSVTETINEVSQEIDIVLKDNEASRFSSIQPRRPQGEKERLLQEIAGSFGALEGQPITKRMVKTCWDEFRSVQERIKSELS